MPASGAGTAFESLFSYARNSLKQQPFSYTFLGFAFSQAMGFVIM
jgi:hypothetical protein